MAIVIVDDDISVRELTRCFLQGAGFEVVGEASNGSEALALIEVVHPAVVVMDARMPAMDGMTATRQLRELHPQLPVIAHTGDATLGEAMTEAGVTHVVPKGSAALLVESIRASLRQASNGFSSPASPAPDDLL